MPVFAEVNPLKLYNAQQARIAPVDSAVASSEAVAPPSYGANNKVLRVKSMADARVKHVLALGRKEGVNAGLKTAQLQRTPTRVHPKKRSAFASWLTTNQPTTKPATSYWAGSSLSPKLIRWIMLTRNSEPRLALCISLRYLDTEDTGRFTLIYRKEKLHKWTGAH